MTGCAVAPEQASRAQSEERRRVLVTGAGGPAAVTLLRSYVTRDDVEVLAGDIDPVAVGLYLVPRNRRHLILRGDDPGFVDHLLALCQSEGVSVLIPTVDSELLEVARRRADFSAVGVTVACASAETMAICLDKAVLAQRCVGVVPVPRTAILDESFDPAGWPLPVITKPRSGSGSRDIVLVTDPAQWATLSHAGDLLVQEYLPGEEYSIDVLAGQDGGVIAAVPRSRLKVDSGISVAGRTHRNPELEQLAINVAKAIGLTGVANVQARQAVDGHFALLEVNPRFPGAMVLTVGAGIDMPALVLDAALGRPLPHGPLPFAEIGVVRHWDEQWVPVDELGALEAPRATTVR
jgi:carbamoyl-phosphate synthase large subunit